MYDDDKPAAPVPIIKAPSVNAPQVSSTGLFIPYALNKKKSSQLTKASTGLANEGNAEDDDDDEDEDDDTNQTDFLGLTKSDQVQISTTDVESVLRETFPKARPTVIEQPVWQPAADDFEDLDQDDQMNQESAHVIDDDEEVCRMTKAFARSFLTTIVSLVVASTLSPEEWTLQRDQTCSHRFDVRWQCTSATIEECHRRKGSDASTSRYSCPEGWSETTRADHLSGGEGESSDSSVRY